MTVMLKMHVILIIYRIIIIIIIVIICIIIIIVIIIIIIIVNVPSSNSGYFESSLGVKIPSGLLCYKTFQPNHFFTTKFIK